MSIRRLVLAYDLEPASRTALFVALEFAVGLEAALHVVHVAPHASSSGDPGRSRAERVLAAVADAGWGLGCEVTVRVVESADVVEAIVKEAAALEADLVVMGSHGRGSNAPRPLGSPAEQVLRRGSCPVVIVRASERPEDAGAAPESSGAATRGC